MAEPGKHEVRARGFALYVGLSEKHAQAQGRELAEVISALRAELHNIAPDAEVHAAIAVAPGGSGGDDLDEVRYALGEPASVARARERALHLTGLVIDVTRTSTRIDGDSIHLTSTEFRLLESIVRRPGRVLTRQQLLAVLHAGEPTPHGRKATDTKERTIDVHVRHIRSKLGRFGDIVRTVPGLGYRFDRHPEVALLDAPLPPLDWSEAG